MSRKINCRDCSKDFDAPVKRGRPPVRCAECAVSPSKPKVTAPKGTTPKTRKTRVTRVKVGEPIRQNREPVKRRKPKVVALDVAGNAIPGTETTEDEKPPLTEAEEMAIAAEIARKNRAIREAAATVTVDNLEMMLMSRGTHVSQNPKEY